MDVSNVSTSSMHKEGLKLVADMWAGIDKLKTIVKKLDNRDIIQTSDLMILAVHRLAFLELVTKGLTFMEMHDAQAYSKFVESKRKIEDMDIEELRVLLR
jgi:hypothetical protein